MTATIVGPGGEVDVSDRPARQLGVVTVDGGTTLPSTLEVANDIGNPIPVNGTVAVTALDIGLSVLRDALTGAPTGTLEAIRSLLAGTVSVGGTVALSSTDRALLEALETVSAIVSGTVVVSNLPATQPVSGPLTDTQLRAAPVPVSFPADESGLTDTELRATPVPVSGTVALSNPTETGLAKDATVLPVLKRFDSVLTAKATYTTSGDHTLIAAPASPLALRPVWFYAQAKGVLDTGTVVVSFTLGARSYEFELTGSQPFAHGAVWDGAVGEALVVNTSSVAAVMVNCDYRPYEP